MYVYLVYLVVNICFSIPLVYYIGQKIIQLLRRKRSGLKIGYNFVNGSPLTPRRSFEEAKAVILFPQFFRMMLGFVGEVSAR